MKAQRAFLGLVAFSLLGSLFSRLTRLDPGPIAPVTSLLTLGTGVAASFSEYVRLVPHAWIRLAITLLFGTAAEMVGLTTGFPFGRYTYTGTWWPSVDLSFGPFPLALPFAWLLMSGASHLSISAERDSKSKVLLLCVVGGLIAALVDLIMEPVLTGPLGYWRWLSSGPLPGGAPWANFFGWWAIAFVAGVTLTFGIPRVRADVPRWVLGGFVLLILGLGAIGNS